MGLRPTGASSKFGPRRSCGPADHPLYCLRAPRASAPLPAAGCGKKYHPSALRVASNLSMTKLYQVTSSFLSQSYSKTRLANKRIGNALREYQLYKGRRSREVGTLLGDACLAPFTKWQTQGALAQHTTSPHGWPGFASNSYKLVNCRRADTGR